jgi:hypothetical protein
MDRKMRAKQIASKLPSIAIAVERGGGEVEAEDEGGAGLEAAMDELGAALKSGDSKKAAAAFKAAMSCCEGMGESEEE